jgi:hypothetical protein
MAMRKFSFVLLLSLAACQAPLRSADAATIVAEPHTDRYGQYWLVYITGKINAGDDKKFRQYTQSLIGQYVSVRLDSLELVAGINIGEQIRSNGFHTDAINKCASVCGLIWLAGKTRWAQTWSQIGFHAVYYMDDKSVASEGNAWVGAYLSRLGFTYRTIQFLTEAPPDSIQWLTYDNAKQYGIDFQYVPVN